MKRAAALTVTPLVRAVEWLFGPKAPGIDLQLMLFAAGWAGLMVAHPTLFDRGTYVGMNWLPDDYWILFFLILTTMHAVGLVRTGWRALRYTACLLSAWIWISVSASFATIEITTGVLFYAVVGAEALAGAIYLSGQPRKVD